MRVKVLQAMQLEDDEWSITVSGKKLPVRKIVFEKPEPPKTSELGLDI